VPGKKIGETPGKMAGYKLIAIILRNHWAGKQRRTLAGVASGGASTWRCFSPIWHAYD